VVKKKHIHIYTDILFGLLTLTNLSRFLQNSSWTARKGEYQSNGMWSKNCVLDQCS